MADAKPNSMKDIYIEKVTLNVGAGKNEELLKKGLKLLEKITSCKPVETKTQKRVPGWGLRRISDWMQSNGANDCKITAAPVSCQRTH